MRITNLAALDADDDLEADLVIVGGGPAAYAIAREFRNSAVRVLILESGLRNQDAAHDALNRLESVGEPSSEARTLQRRRFHGASAPLWSHEAQAFGVRCRVLGGSTDVWAGKSAAFDPIDYAARDWVPHSGWPVTADDMRPFIDRAADILNLGPNTYDEGFWALSGATPPGPPLDPDLLRSFFWQFSRSRTDRLDFTRFKREFELLDAPNVRVVINATATCLRPDVRGTAVQCVEVTSLEGVVRQVRTRVAVLAAGAIENPRLLLLSRRQTGNPFGDRFGLVGRFMMDHPSATIGRFARRDCAPITRRFGFYGLGRDGQVHMYMHGLALSPELQRRESLLNCAAYMMEDRAPDDPWAALRRLLRGDSDRPLSDALTTLAGSGLVAKGMASRLLSSTALPNSVRGKLIDALVRYAPNGVVREYRERGLPHKLAGINIDAITEQRPNPDSRLTLGEARDALGSPIAKVDWRIDVEAYQSLIRMGRLIAQELPRVGLPEPVLEPWVVEERPDIAPIIDMAHTAGTTRMSGDPRSGVVDTDCSVHGLNNLYIAGASVFPTSGHANPTLMVIAMSIRLADRLKLALASGQSLDSSRRHA
jgi:choline dehydrogenase-like flavoprotein